jgi:dTMP kinase
MPYGALIVFEGSEGAGKSTQIRLLAEWLTMRDRPVVTAREPGGTEVGDEIRRLVLERDVEITPRAEALLFMASRAELVERRIRPSLAGGATVLVDRFFLSTYAYQGAGRGVPEEELRAANRIATAGLVPDLTLLFTIPAEVGLARASRRGAYDRVERAELAFHERIASAFASFVSPSWQQEHPECGPIVLIDATASEATVFERILHALRTRWPASFPLETSSR